MEKKTVKHTLRMSEKESRKLERWSDAAGIPKAEYVRQKVFGREPQPLPSPAFWSHLSDLYAVHNRLEDEESRRMLRSLILAVQSDATQPREVTSDGDHQTVAH